MHETPCRTAAPSPSPPRTCRRPARRCGPPGQALRCGHGRRHAVRGPGTRVRAVLHHQGHRQGLGARFAAGLRIRAAIRRSHHDQQRGRHGHDRDAVAAALTAAAALRPHSPTLQAPRPRAAWPSAADRCCSSKTTSRLRRSRARCSRVSGYSVMHVTNAAAALGALANDRSVDIVLSDIMMPGGVSGLELAREIKRRQPDLPVVLVTGYGEAAASIERREFGIPPQAVHPRCLGRGHERRNIPRIRPSPVARSP